MAYVAKQVSVLHEPAANKTHTTDYISFKQEQCYLSTKHSAVRSAYHSAQTAAAKTIQLPSNQTVKGHVIHRPVAIRPEVKTVETLSPASIAHTASTSPANIRKPAPVPSVTPSPMQASCSSVNVLMTKKYPSSVINVSMTRTFPSSTANETIITREIPALSQNYPSTNVVPTSLSAGVVDGASKSAIENKNSVASSQKVFIKTMSAASTSLSCESSKCLLPTCPEVSSSSIASLANNNMLCVVSSPKVHIGNLFNMTSTHTSPQCVSNSFHPVEENKNSVVTTSNQKVDSPVSKVMKIGALLPSVSSSFNNSKGTLTLKTNSIHQVHHLERTRVKSPECIFMRKQSLNAERKLTCQECNGEFVTHLAYHTHMIFHVRNDPVRKTQYKKQTVCSDCGKHFSNPFTLKTHMYTHTGEKPFGCPYCKRMFADRSNCRAHMRIHTDKKKIFSCTTCNKSFTQRRYLYKHMVEVCDVPERMFRTGLMSVKYHAEDEDISNPSMEKQIITRYRKNSETSVHSVNDYGFQTEGKLNDCAVAFKDDANSTCMLEKLDYSEDEKEHKDDVINECPASVKKKSSSCVQPKMLPYVSCVRIDENKYGLPRKSRKQDLSKTRVLLPDSFTFKKSPLIKCMRIDDELPYLRPLFKEMFSNPNAYLTLQPSVSDDAARNTDDPSHRMYKLCLGKRSKFEANLQGEDEETIKAAKLAAAKEWQSRLVNGDFTTDEEDEFDEEESSGEDIKKSNLFTGKRLLSSSDDTDFTSDEDFTPNTGMLHNWSSGRRRRLKRSVKHVNFKRLHYGAEDSDTSASSDVSEKHRTSSHTITDRPKPVGKIIVRKVQTGRSTQHKIVKSEPSKIAKRPYNIQSKNLHTRVFGKTSSDKIVLKQEPDKKSDKESEKFHCVECDLKFMQQTNLVLHIVTTHLQTASFYQRHYYGSEQFVCKYCELACYSFQAYIQHVPVHTNDVLEKMAKYVISRSGRNFKRIKKNYRPKIKREVSDNDSSNMLDEQLSFKQSEPKLKRSSSAVSDKTSASVSTSVLQGESDTSADSTSADSVGEKTCYSLKYAKSNCEMSLTKAKDTNIEANDKSPSDIKQNQTTNNETKSDGRKSCKVEITSPDHGHRKRIVIQLKENAVVDDLSPKEISKICKSQIDSMQVESKHSHILDSKSRVNNQEVQCPKANVMRQKINPNTNGRPVKIETDVHPSQSVKTKPGLTKSLESSSFMDSFLSYVQTEESKLKKLKEAQVGHHKAVKNKNMENSKKTTANEKNRNNSNSRSFENDSRQSTLNCHESKSSSSFMNGQVKKGSNTVNSDKTSTKNLDGGLNMDSVDKLKSLGTTDDTTISSRHRQKASVADEKTCDSSSVGQVSFSNCSQSAEDHYSSDIVVFGADSMMIGTDEQTLDKLTQLRVSKNRNQLVASSGKEASTPNKRVSEAINCDHSLQMMSMKTLNSESAALGEAEESLLDSDSVLNTMLNLSSNVTMVSELHSVKVSHCSSTESVHQDENTHSNMQQVKTVAKESCSSSSSEKHMGFNKESNFKISGSLSSSSLNDVGVEGKILKENIHQQLITGKVDFQKDKRDSQLSKVSSLQTVCNTAVTNTSKAACNKTSISRMHDLLSSSGVSSLHDDDLVKSNDNSLMLNCSQNNNDSTCSSMEEKVSPSSQMYDEMQVLCSMSPTSEMDNLKDSSNQNVTEICSEDLPELNATDSPIECEATLQTTPLLSQIVPDLADAISQVVDKDVDEMTISCEGTLKSVIVNINIDESNSGSPVLIEDENVDESNSAKILIHDESAPVGFRQKGSSSSVSECSEDSVLMDAEDSLTESDASSATSQHNVTRSGRAIKPPKRCTEWFSENMSSKKHCVNSTVKNRPKHQALHSALSAHHTSPTPSLVEKPAFKHHACCATRKSPRSEHAPKTKTCPCCL